MKKIKKQILKLFNFVISVFYISVNSSFSFFVFLAFLINSILGCFSFLDNFEFISATSLNSFSTSKKNSNDKRAIMFPNTRILKKVKKFVRYKEGAEMYSMCQSKFERMAREAKATYKLDKLVLVNTELFEKYLETFHVVE